MNFFKKALAAVFSLAAVATPAAADILTIDTGGNPLAPPSTINGQIVWTTSTDGANGQGAVKIINPNVLTDGASILASFDKATGGTGTNVFAAAVGIPNPQGGPAIGIVIPTTLTSQSPTTGALNFLYFSDPANPFSISNIITARTTAAPNRGYYDFGPGAFIVNTFYGAFAIQGPNNPDGAIYSNNQSTTNSAVAAFQQPTTGANPEGGLVAGDGKTLNDSNILYGTTSINRGANISTFYAVNTDLKTIRTIAMFSEDVTTTPLITGNTAYILSNTNLYTVNISTGAYSSLITLTSGSTGLPIDGGHNSQAVLMDSLHRLLFVEPTGGDFGYGAVDVVGINGYLINSISFTEAQGSPIGGTLDAQGNLYVTTTKNLVEVTFNSLPEPNGFMLLSGLGAAAWAFKRPQDRPKVSQTTPFPTPTPL